MTRRYAELLIYILHGHFCNSFFGICFIRSCTPLNVRWNVDESGSLRDDVFWGLIQIPVVVLTLPLLCVAKWMFLWPVRYFCCNVRHSGLSSQASDSITHFPCYYHVQRCPTERWLPWPVFLLFLRVSNSLFPWSFFRATHPELKADLWILGKR